MDGEERVLNNNPETFEDVNVYASGNYDESAAATIRNFIISSRRISK